MKFEKVWVNYLVDILLLISGFLVGVTGTLKQQFVRQIFGLTGQNFPFFYVSKVHDFAGIAVVALAIIHVVLHWQFISSMTKNFFKKIAGKKEN